MLRKILIAFILFLLCFQLPAGWIIRERSRYPVENKDDISTIYFQKNFIKTVVNSFVSIFNLNRNELIFLNLQEETYWSGSLEDYKTEIRKATIEKIRQELIKIPSDQGENYRDLYESLIRDLENPAPAFYSDVSARVEMTTEQRTVLEFQARKFNIYLAGFLVEEVWISNRIKISDEVDLDKFRLFMNEMSLGNMEPDHRTSPEYLHLLKSGYPLYSREITEEGEIVTEVVKVEKEQFTAQEFAIPVNFRKVTLSNFEIF